MSDIEQPDLLDAVSKDEVDALPDRSADPAVILEKHIPEDIRLKYEVHSYRSAAVILSQTRPQEFEELLGALRSFRITREMIRKAGGNESEIPKLFSRTLRPLGWYETVIQGDLVLRLTWREKVKEKNGKAIFADRSRELVRKRFVDGHKIDYVKGKTAFDLEWNSKDQTFDRDLYAFRAFAEAGIIDVAVLVTRSASLNQVFRELGPALKKDGTEDQRQTHVKYGASTTWMGKLLYRLNAGRNGACPVLALGITPACVEGWSEAHEG